MKQIKLRRAFTLMELIISLVLVSAIIMVVGVSFIFFKKQIDIYAERQHIYSQIAYAFEDMKLRVISATGVDSGSAFQPPADSGEVEIKNEFMFRGQKDIYNVTPDDLSDDVWYRYAIDPATHDLVLYTGDNGKEVLVEGKYKPKLEFSYMKGFEPNFFVASITVPSGKVSYIDIPKDISRMEGLRIWFVDVVK